MGRSDCDNLGLVAFKEHLGAARSVPSHWTFPATPNSGVSGSSTTTSGMITFIVTGYTETVSASGPFSAPGPSGSCTVAGTATLVSTGSTVCIDITTPSTPPPRQYYGVTELPQPRPDRLRDPRPAEQRSRELPFLGTVSVRRPNSVVWVNAHISSPSKVPTNTTTSVAFTEVVLGVNGTFYGLPNGTVMFVRGTPTPTTAVNSDGSWTTTVSPSQSGDIFITGQAIGVNSNLENGGSGNTSSTLFFTTNSNDSALDFQWQWDAAVYTSWPGNAAADIEPVDALQHGGAPLNPAVEADLIQGPRGGGGSNFTGSWSGTGQGNCP